MKKHILTLSLIGIFLLSACIRNSDKDEKDEQKIDSLLSYLSENSNAYQYDYNKFSKDTIDYTKIEISEDSIDLALFNLILEYEKYSEANLLKNIEVLINKGANPNAVIEYQYSVRKLGTYIPIVKHFYRNRYRTHSANSTAFHESINTENEHIILKLISLKANVNSPNKNGVYPIDLAVSKDNERIINLLIEKGADVSKTDLSLSENIDIIEKLVKLGADPLTIKIDFALDDPGILKRVLKLEPNMKSQEIEYAKVFNNNEILELLLDAGIGSNVKGTFPDNCPLVFGAIKYGDLNSVKRLKEAGISVTTKCKSGPNETPLFYAINLHKVEIVEYYLKTEKVNPNQKDWKSMSALIIAVGTDNDIMINLLIDSGASLEYSGYFGKSPLMYAVDYDHYISAQTLINKGANLNFKNKYGETPVTIAIKEHNFAMLKLLIDSGARSDIKFKGMSMPDYAVSVEAPNMIIEYLKKI